MNTFIWFAFFRTDLLFPSDFLFNFFAKVFFLRTDESCQMSLMPLRTKVLLTAVNLRHWRLRPTLNWSLPVCSVDDFLSSYLNTENKRQPFETKCFLS